MYDVADIRAVMDDAVRKLEIVKKRLGQSPTAPEIGDLFIFKDAIEENYGFEWAVIQRHVDDADLWYVVPFDQSDCFIGTWDVQCFASPSHCSHGALRCGCGQWLHTSDFDLGVKTGFVSADAAIESRRKLSAMVRGEAIEDRDFVDSDPDYQELIDAAIRCGESLARSGS